MTDTRVERTKVFVSYSHQDGEWLKRLRVHLKPLERRYGLDVWADTNIKPGSQWRDEIKRGLETARVAVLLVSADFIASDFISSNELPPLLRAAEEEGTLILPVILSPSMFSRMDELARFQTVNDPSMPLVDLDRGDQEAVLVKLTEEIESAFGFVPKEKEEKGVAAMPFAATRPASAPPQQRDTETQPQKVRLHIPPAIWLAVIAVAVILIGGAYYWQFVRKAPGPERRNYTGRVTDARTNKAIHNAKVSIEEGQEVPQIQTTDSEGIFHVALKNSSASARIRVEANGYDPYDRAVSFSRTGVEPLALNPMPTPTPASSPKPATIGSRRRPTAGPKCTAAEKLLGKC
jgi:hypothetical protein